MELDSLGDRRAALRFDLGGQVWGTIETLDPLPLRNIGRGGLLVESSRPLRIDTLHRLHLVLQGYESIVEGRVRHVTGMYDGRAQVHYLIGFQFVEVDPATQERIDQVVPPGGGYLVDERDGE